MKRALLALIMVTALVLSSFAQPYSTFKLSTSKPQPGKPISFLYSGVNAKQLFPILELRYKTGLRIGGISVKGKPTNKGNEGSFVLPDSIKAFYVKTNAYVKPAEFYVFQVYQKGKMIPGALAESAAFYADAPDYFNPYDVPKALTLYRQEFEKHPQLRPQYLIHYYRAGGKAPDELILKELEKTWQDSLQSGRSERFLIDLFDATSRYPAMPLKEGLKEKIHNKYSLGTMALRKAKSRLFFDNRNFYLLSNIEKEFPLQVKFGALDSLYSGWGLAEFRAGNLERGEAMLNKIQNKRMQEELYNKAAYAFMFSGKNLDKAEIYAQKAVDMSAQSSRKFDQIDQLYTLAQVQYYRKNLSAAIGTLEKAIALRGEEIDAVIIHVYLKYLMEAGEYKKAYNGALKFLKYDSVFIRIKDIFLESFAMVKGTPAEAEAYYDRLTNETKLQPPPPWGKVDIKSADFTLKDLDGKPFKLSDHLGKTVVLYFFKTRFGSEYRYEMVTKFIEVAASLENRKDVLFVGIDRSAVYDSNRIYLDEEQRIERVKQLMKGATSNLKVLLDEAINDPQKQDFHYKVSRLYSLASPGLFYVIDGKGILRYKYYFDGSSGIAGLTLLRALNAVK